MNKIFHLSNFILLILLINFSKIFAGAWNLDKGRAYTQFGFTYLNYSGLLNGFDQNIDLKRSITDNTIQFYSEYGLTKKINLILNVPFKMVSSSESLNKVENDPYLSDTLSANELTGFSNISFGLRFTLADKSYVLTAQLDVVNKMHKYDDGSGLQIGYDAGFLNPSIHYGKGWNKAYLQIQTGFLLNTGKYSQNVFGNIELGKRIGKKENYLVFRTDVKLPITTGTFEERNAVQTGLFRDNSSFISPGLKWIKDLGKQYFINIAAYGAVYSKFEGAQATLNFGMARKW